MNKDLLQSCVYLSHGREAYPVENDWNEPDINRGDVVIACPNTKPIYGDYILCDYEGKTLLALYKARGQQDYIQNAAYELPITWVSNIRCVMGIMRSLKKKKLELTKISLVDAFC